MARSGWIFIRLGVRGRDGDGSACGGHAVSPIPGGSSCAIPGAVRSAAGRSAPVTIRATRVFWDRAGVDYLWIRRRRGRWMCFVPDRVAPGMAQREPPGMGCSWRVRRKTHPPPLRTAPGPPYGRSAPSRSSDAIRSADAGGQSARHPLPHPVIGCTLKPSLAFGSCVVMMRLPGRKPSPRTSTRYAPSAPR